MTGTDARINIIYASNDGYAGHLAASLCSLLDHNRMAEHIDIYVLSVGMCTEYQNRLKSLAASFGRSLSVVELGNLKERFPYKIDTRGFDISAMGRLFAPEWPCLKALGGHCIWTVIPLYAVPFYLFMRQSWEDA